MAQQQRPGVTSVQGFNIGDGRTIDSLRVDRVIPISPLELLKIDLDSMLGRSAWEELDRVVTFAFNYHNNVTIPSLRRGLSTSHISNDYKDLKLRNETLRKRYVDQFEQIYINSFAGAVNSARSKNKNVLHNLGQLEESAEALIRSVNTGFVQKILQPSIKHFTDLSLPLDVCLAYLIAAQRSGSISETPKVRAIYEVLTRYQHVESKIPQKALDLYKNEVNSTNDSVRQDARNKPLNRYVSTVYVLVDALTEISRNKDSRLSFLF